MGRTPPPPPPMYGKRPTTPRPGFAAGYQPIDGPRRPVPAGRAAQLPPKPGRSIEEEWDEYKRTTPPELRDEEPAPGPLIETPTPGQKETR